MLLNRQLFRAAKFLYKNILSTILINFHVQILSVGLPKLYDELLNIIRRFDR